LAGVSSNATIENIINHSEGAESLGQAYFDSF
jgi:hypothetical protein